ncbi:alpha/beta hydrolase family protein [Nocardioides jishulii]|uniref:Peptidase S9 n=1 Tax=Nocardioides jishulii TaxID=2575440 RepID=A0A4U2YRD4_9ACTN|nr:prolyl oligopeptidase family serine peptidase [Nocardioides jishulii]QCX26219.1 peptidase S9 [Nocardioides jishulii]TKI63977.1 peptidase S9 [Nocardioides jishulii]
MARRTAAALLLLVLASGCTGDPGSEDPSAAESTGSPSTSSPSAPTATPNPTQDSSPAADPVSVPGVAAQTHVGDRLRLGDVRERTAAFTSYDVTWRVRSSGPGADTRPLQLSGVLNVPSGDGPFPAVVLAHGYIDPAVYESGQGMTRERGFLAERGFVALHVDYRGHAGSGADPSDGTDLRLGYAVDVIAAIDALRRSEVAVDDDRIAVFGRSMGGGVVQKVAQIAPDAAHAVVAWASVSSLEAENFNHFIRGDGDARATAIRERRGLPEQAPEFWRAASSRPYLDRITVPVLAVHGRFDDTCPPRWARATQRAMQRAGVDSDLVWYDDGHAFGPAFVEAMERTVRFLEQSAP